MSNDNLVALVTGCSRRQGIGFEVCRQLGEQGCTVILTARDGEKAGQLASTLREARLDITDTESIKTLTDFVARQYGRLDILINNATGSAGSNMAPAASADLDIARQIMEVTLLGTWRMIQAVAPLLDKSNAARIVNVSSSAGLHSDPVLGLTGSRQAAPAYGIAKAALNALTARVAGDFTDTTIKVNAICPGFTATYPGMEKLGAHPVAEGASGIVWAATLDADGPTGGFYRNKELLSW